MDDLINRQAAIDIADDLRDCISVEGYWAWTERIRKLPSAQPERKTGRWKKTYLDHEAMGERSSIFYCSVCNQCIAYPVNYCPSCGADMRGEKDE